MPGPSTVPSTLTDRMPLDPKDLVQGRMDFNGRPTLRFKAYENRLRSASRWADFAGEPLEAWLAAAHAAPVLPFEAIGPRGTVGKASDTSPAPSPLHIAITNLQPREVAKLLQSGIDIRWDMTSEPQFNINNKTVSPLSTAMSFSTHVYKPKGSANYQDLQWQPEELDAHALIVGMLLAAGAGVSSQSFQEALHQDNPGLLGLMVGSWPVRPISPEIAPDALLKLVSQKDTTFFLEKMQHLVKAGWDPHNAPKGKFSPLQAAMDKHNATAILALMDLGCRFGPVHPGNENPLQAVCFRMGNHPRLTQRMIDSGLPIDTRNGIGATPLHSAAQYDGLQSLHALINAGAEVNVQDDLGLTPLYRAAELGNADSVEILLAAGADPFVVPEGGSSLVETARRRLAQHDCDEDDHRTVVMLEKLMLVETLKDFDALNEAQEVPKIVPARLRVRL